MKVKIFYGNYGNYDALVNLQDEINEWLAKYKPVIKHIKQLDATSSGSSNVVISIWYEQSM